MSVLVYTESENGALKKNAFEVASYANAVASQMGTATTAVAFNCSEGQNLGNYGVSKVLNISDDKLKKFSAKAYAHALVDAAKKIDAKVIVVSSSTDSKFLTPILAAKLKAGYVPNVVSAPEGTSPFKVKRTDKYRSKDRRSFK